MDADSYAASMSAALDLYQAMRPRSLQPGIGVSSVGHCASEAKFRMQGVEPTDAPASRQALWGTSLHETIKAARAEFNPELLLETPLLVTMPSGLVIPGTADEIDPSEPSVTDAKTVADGAALTTQRRVGASDQQRYQRHMYYLGAIQADLVPTEGIVRNVYLDRAGQESDPLVEQEPFDMKVIVDADRWMADVAYAAEHNEDAPQDKHFTWCRQYCQFFTHCRGGQIHPDLIVTDAEMILAAELLLEGRAGAKVAKGLEENAKRVLAPLQLAAEDDVAGYEVGDYRVRWQWINTAAGGHWKCLVEAREPVSA